MSLVSSFFDSPSANYASVPGVSGNGTSGSGSVWPNGIPSVLTLENGVMRTYHADAHASTSGPRTEIYFTSDGFNTELWYAWDFMLPTNYWNGFDGIVTIGQFHDYPDTGDPASRQPNFMLQFNRGNLQTVWPGSALPSDTTDNVKVPGVALSYDRYYSVCVRVKWTTDSTGFREVFVDRVPIYRKWNLVTSYTDTLSPYFKLGVYITNDGNLAGDKVIYVRNLKLYTGNDGYQTVLGGVPIVATRLVQP
jgi:hypothetical protein